MTTITIIHSHSITSQPSPPLLCSTASTGALGKALSTEQCVRAALVGLVQSDHWVRNQGEHVGDVHVGRGGQE